MFHPLRLVAAAVLLALMPTATTAFSSRTLDSIAPLQFETVGFDPTTHEIYQRVGNQCTSFSVHEKQRLWLTARHCILDNGGDPLGIPFYIAGHDAAVYAEDVDHDLVVLQTKAFKGRALKLASREPDYLNPVTIIGYPYGYGPLVVTGQVAAYAFTFNAEVPAYLVFVAPTCPSNSGSPVMDIDDRVVSVVRFAFSQGCSSMGGGPSLKVLKAFLQPVLKAADKAR